MKKESTGKNTRSLKVIAAEIHKRMRDDLFAIGDLLLEAKASCEESKGYGFWGDWLVDNFEWSQATAENYMNVARLSEPVKKLKLARVTFYELGREDEALLPAIIDALVKFGAAKTQLKPHEAAHVIRLVRLRHEHGDFPDATLLALDEWCRPGAEAADEIAAALKRQKPTTRETAEKIVAPILEKVRARFNERLADAKPQQTPTPEIDQPSDEEPSEDTRAFLGAVLEGADLGKAYAAGLGEKPEPSPDELLVDALKVLLHHTQRKPLPTLADSDISSLDVMEVIDFLGALHRAMLRDSKAKIVADKAEARSRKNGGAS